jgi:peptidoglycan/xylan/chitin deacetylase (PgdA/CDA1 family)
MAEPGIVFLMYHELELPGRSACQSEPGYVRYVLPASEFQAQMQSLKQLGMHGLSVSDALAFPDEPAVAITFDDGCETDVLTAAPILRELGFGATFYVTVGFLGRRGYMSHEQLRELRDSSFEIGCHSLTHPYLTDLDDAGLHREIVEAKRQLEELAGKPIKHFSCPGGRYDRRVVKIARAAGYGSVANSRTHANSKSTDPFALGRVAVLRGTPPQKFAAFCHGRGLWQLTARDTVQATARRFLGNSVYDRVRAVLLGGGPSR